MVKTYFSDSNDFFGTHLTLRILLNRYLSKFRIRYEVCLRRIVYIVNFRISETPEPYGRENKLSNFQKSSLPSYIFKETNYTSPLEHEGLHQNCKFYVPGVDNLT